MTECLTIIAGSNDWTSGRLAHYIYFQPNNSAIAQKDCMKLRHEVHAL